MKINIFDYGMNGEGVGKIDGKVVLTNNALIGEDVEIEVVEDNKNYSIAKTEKIISPSLNRTVPVCPYFFNCGGCQLQHMNYNEQLKFKSLLIRKTLKKIAAIDFEISTTIPCSSAINYRNKMSFSVNNTNCGLLKFNSQDIVNVESCPLASYNINHVLRMFKNFISTNPQSEIKNLVVREINSQILVGIVTSKHVDLAHFFNEISTQFSNIGLFEIINTRKDSVVLSGKVIHIGGLKEITIKNFVIDYSVDLMGFHQTNLEIQNKIYQKVLDNIDENSSVLNGFSGQGLLSAILATKAKNVVGIEINKSSHKSAELLKAKNKIKNLTNICGDFHKEIKNLKKKHDTLILDPTKKGCGKQVMQEIIGFKNIIYISCNPIALAKDLNIIKNHYSIEEITPFDMFPNTISLETYVKLKLK